MYDFSKFIQIGKISYNILKYIPGLAKIDYQGQLYSTKTNRKYGDWSYKNKYIIKFNVQFKENHYTNFQNIKFLFSDKNQINSR